MPRNRRDLVAAAKPVLEAAVGNGRRRRFVDRVNHRLNLWPKSVTDFTGWSVAEFKAYQDWSVGQPPPPARAGHDSALLVNRLSNMLPVEALLLAREITDVAPPAGSYVNPTLGQILDKYLPESLKAFDTTGPRRLKASAEELLLAELELLHQAAIDVQRAEAEHNDRELQIQDAFLKERFADLTPSQLDLETPEAPVHPAQERRRRTAPPAGDRMHLRPDAHPLVTMAREPGSERKFTSRLALPKGHPATLGCVFEVPSGATGFWHQSTRRWLMPTKMTGFHAPQVDLTLRANIAGLRRFMIFVRSPARTAPTDCVLFLRDGSQRQADLATMLANHAGAELTVICTGYATSDGFVLRNESLLYADLRGACEAFGYTHVTWLDRNTPIV